MFWSGWLFFEGEPSPLARWLETWSGHPIENHAIVGSSLAEGGLVKSISEQFKSITKKPNITTLIMDGGGNDVISHRYDCIQFNDKCISMIQDGLSIVSDIFHRSYDSGISNILYLGFYYLSGLERAADYANPLLQTICNHSRVSCHFVDPRYNQTTGSGLPTPMMLSSDGIHPNKEGYKILAEMIWNVAKNNDIPI
jgi:hypothetical protein